jgi:hypothetical protein
VNTLTQTLLPTHPSVELLWYSSSIAIFRRLPSRPYHVSKILFRLQPVRSSNHAVRTDIRRATNLKISPAEARAILLSSRPTSFHTLALGAATHAVPKLRLPRLRIYSTSGPPFGNHLHPQSTCISTCRGTLASLQLSNRTVTH